MILLKNKFKMYIDSFNHMDEEPYIQHINNKLSWSWLRGNIPFFECPDNEIEEKYYFRWWTYRKHIKYTSDGFIITEFLPKVSWSGKHNSIACSLGHHIYEGRWLRDDRYVKEYIDFWLLTNMGEDQNEFSVWLADAFYQFCKVNGNMKMMVDKLQPLVENFKMRIVKHFHNSGLLWSQDSPHDAMEFSVSGHGLRPTLNSYMYGDACAIARVAYLAGEKELYEEFKIMAKRLKELVQQRLWDKTDLFFKVIPLTKNEESVTSWEFNNINPLRNVREVLGFTPWYFNLPDEGYEIAWRQLFDHHGFFAPFGPTTTEQRHPGFGIFYTGEELIESVKDGRVFKTFDVGDKGHECLWNGPSWPYATSVTLTALSNLLNNYHQLQMTKNDYISLFKIYTCSQNRVLSDGTTVPWIDECLNPYTGDWISRSRLSAWNNGTWDSSTDKGGYERGKDYNHSTYCDHIISGIVGLRAREDDVIEINPLIPDDLWDYFCLDYLRYHGKEITIFYDKSGDRYGMGSGLNLYVDGKLMVHSDKLGRIVAQL